MNEAGKQTSIRAETVPLLELVKRRPKVARRRVTDRELISAINAYDLNRGTQAEVAALAHFEAVYSRRPVGL